MDKNIDYEKFNNKGLTGLVNLGNTCFMNSAIHCLSNTIELTDYILNNKYNINKNKKEASIINEWKRLLDGIWSSNCTISPRSFNKTVRKLSSETGFINFTGFSQNDVQEFLVFIIDSMHEAISREVVVTINGNIITKVDKMAYDAMKTWKSHFKNNYSKIIDLFYGQLASKITSLEGHKEILSNNYDPICFFTLPIPNISKNNQENITIYDCFDLFTLPEILDGDNKIKDERTNEYLKAKKTIKIWNFPKILIVSFKRFRNNFSKINNLIDFPLII